MADAAGRGAGLDWKTSLQELTAGLGLGVPDHTPSWGSLISDSLSSFDVTWWLWFFPGLLLLFTVLAFNLLGDGLRDALDPRSNR